MTIRSMPNNDNYRKGWDRIFMKKKKFVVVCGPGRSGTSLATKLVEAAGFNLGKCLPPNKEGSLRHGYGEHPLTNTQGFYIEDAIDKLETEGTNCVKLIHLHGQWIPRLMSRDYDVRVVVTTRDVKEIWDSGMDIYPGWRPNAIQAICDTAEGILRECGKYLYDVTYNAYQLPFQKVIEKDRNTLIGLIDFLTYEKMHEGAPVFEGNQHTILEKMEGIIKPDVVQHARISG